MQLQISALDRNEPFAARLHELQGLLAGILGDGETLRLASAVYDGDSDLLHTFADSGDGASTLTHYSVKLGDVPSFDYARTPGGTQVVDDLAASAGPVSAHRQRLLEMGYRASFARAVHDGDRLIGIVFANAHIPGYFDAARVAAIDPYMRLAALHLTLELSHYRTFSAAIATAQAVSAYRDTDTAQHLSRMSHLAAIIADGIAAKYDLSDGFVAKLFQFAPLHDIGKVGVPDSILLKQGKLTPEEFEAMKCHVKIGLEMVDRVIGDLALADLPGIEILRNAVRYHHEKLDGSGYPYGLAGDQVPIEAQIMAVADIFDALTSHRPYKEPWPVERAFEELRKMAPAKLNADCVEALIASAGRVREVMRTFGDTPAVAA